MADEWRLRFWEGAYPWLSPHEDLDEDGYTNLEEQLNQTLSYRIKGRQDIGSAECPHPIRSRRHLNP